jgi:hypothetical protein
VTLYALAFSQAQHQTIETFLTREEAESVLREVLADEPG